MRIRKRKRDVPAGATVRGVGAIPHLDDTDHPHFDLGAKNIRRLEREKIQQDYDEQEKLERAERTAIICDLCEQASLPLSSG